MKTHTPFASQSLLCIAVGLLLNVVTLSAQENKVDSKPDLKAMMRDTFDGQLDFSRFLIDAHGFIPIPFIVTESAVGGFGFALIPVFITPPKSKFATKRTPPDITGAIGLYTVNDSWMLGGFRLASIPKWSMKYRVALAYTDLNISFYREIPSIGEKQFWFNFVSKPVVLSLSKKVTKQEIYLGLQYSLLDNNIHLRFQQDLPESIPEQEFISTTASFGPFLDWDRRDNTFTPDHGAILHTEYTVNDDWTGSDFQFERLNGFLNWFIPVRERWVSGLRVDVQHAFGEAPFYMLPFINLRGVPTLRYKGQTTALVETEQRFDFNRRWSVIGFAGYGKAIQENESFEDGKTVYNVGGGFRYLLARVFKVRAGIDIGFGPDSWGYYIVFGHNWNR